MKTAASVWGVACGVSLALLIRFSQREAEAWHPFDPHKHLVSILPSGGPELNCVDVQDSSLPFTDARDFIVQTLYPGYHPGERHWHGTDGVDFDGQTIESQCPVPDPNWTLRIYFHVRLDWDNDPCGNRTWGCERLLWLVFDPGRGHPEAEYRVSEIFLDSDRLNSNDGYHLVNHEVGHSLGLCDGGPTLGPYAGCDHSSIHAQCADSVMHSYGCPNIDWPTAPDVAIVAGLSPAESSDWNNFSPGPKAFF